MGDATSSMIYGLGAFLVIYLVGVGIYQIYLMIKKHKEKKDDFERNQNE